MNVLPINVLGNFVLGIFSIVSVAWNFEPKYSLLIAIGFSCSFTTMSSFALESSNLLDNKQFSFFGLNILAHEILGPFAEPISGAILALIAGILLGGFGFLFTYRGGAVDVSDKQKQ